MKPWKRLLWAALAGLCLVALGLMCRGDSKTTAQLTPQGAAERWETAEKPYAMASVFLEPSSAIPQERLPEFYLAVENAMTAGGVGSEEYPWYYAASYQTDASLSASGGTTAVELLAVGGDFFEMHPMKLLSGWYMEERDVMHDRIVLDRQSAWDLFYSENVAGQYVTLNGVSYQVAAVVDYEDGTYTELAAGNTRRAWVYADSPGIADATAGFTCIEVVLPQPVKEFAAATLKSALGDMIPETTVITDNSARFSLENRWEVLRNMGLRGISNGAVPYPYWENAAQLTENHLALRLIPEGLLLGFPLMSLLVLLLWLNHRRTWGLHTVKDLAETAVDRKRQRDYYGNKTEHRAEEAQRQALKYSSRGRSSIRERRSHEKEK